MAVFLICLILLHRVYFYNYKGECAGHRLGTPLSPVLKSITGSARYPFPVPTCSLSPLNFACHGRGVVHRRPCRSPMPSVSAVISPEGPGHLLKRSEAQRLVVNKALATAVTVAGSRPEGLGMILSLNFVPHSRPAH